MVAISFFTSFGLLTPVPLHFRSTPAQDGDSLLQLKELRLLSKSQIRGTKWGGAGCSLYIPGMPAGPWNVVEPRWERGSKAPSFLSQLAAPIFVPLIPARISSPWACPTNFKLSSPYNHINQSLKINFYLCLCLSISSIYLSGYWEIIYSLIKRVCIIYIF